MQFLQRVIATSPVRVLPGRFAVVECGATPDVALCFAVMNDGDEVTAIIEETHLVSIAQRGCQKWFRILQLNVSAPFEAPGFLATAASAIAALGVNVFMVSTFSRDYILVRSDDLEQSLSGLQTAGFPITGT